jgi:hypothetical protein
VPHNGEKNAENLIEWNVLNQCGHTHQYKKNANGL